MTALLMLPLTLGSIACGDDRSETDLVTEGADLFSTTCAACHGPDLKGTTSGPPLLDQIYAPDHHPDSSFVSAVKNGSPQHHWSFGAMPAQQGFSDADIEAIIAYVRSEQRDAGIDAGTER